MAYNIRDDIFSIYDYDEDTLQELLCKYYTKLIELDKKVTVNDEMVDFLLGEGLSIEVANQLNKMYQDGTLQLTMDGLIQNVQARTTTLEQQMSTVIPRVDDIHNQVGNYVYPRLEKVENEVKAINTFCADEKCRHIAHRGYSALYPENTIIAFEKAKGRFWGVECDVTTSVNGTWWLMHDDTIDRTTNGSGVLSALGDDVIQQLIIDEGKNVKAYKNQRVPTLAQYLKVCRKYNLIPVIEIKYKSYTDAEVTNLINLMKDYGFEHTGVVISFDKVVLQQLRRLNPNIRLQLVCSLWDYNDLVFCLSIGKCDYDLNYGVATEGIIIEAHRLGLKVNVWTCDELTDYNKLKSYGVDYITTNNIIEGGN